MIHNASTMDKPIDREPEKRRRMATIGAAAAVLVIGGLALAPSIGRWASSETSVPRAQIRTATVERGNLVREVSADGRVVAASSPTSFSPAQGIVSIGRIESWEVGGSRRWYSFPGPCRRTGSEATEATAEFHRHW